MNKVFSLLLVGFLVPGMASAQNAAVQNVTPESVEKFIKDVMKTEAQKKNSRMKTGSSTRPRTGFMTWCFSAALRNPSCFNMRSRSSRPRWKN